MTELHSDRPGEWAMTELGKAAVDFCQDCYADTPDDVTEAEALAVVDRDYVGGMAAFASDSGITVPTGSDSGITVPTGLL